MTTITLSLISHTNVGKTTLMRTLLGRDVGEVSDHAHVTLESERHCLCETPEGDRLDLWDTPGFGDSAQLLNRLKQHDKPIKWMLLQTWDRLANKPLYCSQQAAKNVHEEADVVLYLVNAAESPEDAAYVDMEMEILSWIGRPVIVLLNQVGLPANREREKTEQDRWQKHLGKFDVLRDVMTLDAFTRCWVQEGVMLRRVRPVLPPEKQAAFDALLDVWLAERRQVFTDSIDAIAAHLATVAKDREPVEKASKRMIGAAVKKLTGRIERSQREANDQLLTLYAIDGYTAADIRADLDDYLCPKPKRNKWLSGAFFGTGSGLAGGIAAGVATGGAMFGVGAATGFLLGFAAGSALQGLFNVIGQGKSRAVACTPEFLDQLTGQSLFYYLAVAHYGRGRGAWREPARIESWSTAIQSAIDSRRSELRAIWKALQNGNGDSTAKLRESVEQLLRELLLSQYPEAKQVLA